jgi:hypothetical protein
MLKIPGQHQVRNNVVHIDTEKEESKPSSRRTPFIRHSPSWEIENIIISIGLRFIDLSPCKKNKMSQSKKLLDPPSVVQSLLQQWNKPAKQVLETHEMKPKKIQEPPKQYTYGNPNSIFRGTKGRVHESLQHKQIWNNYIEHGAKQRQFGFTPGAIF